MKKSAFYKKENHQSNNKDNETKKEVSFADSESSFKNKERKLKSKKITKKEEEEIEVIMEIKEENSDEENTLRDKRYLIGDMSSHSSEEDLNYEIEEKLDLKGTIQKAKIHSNAKKILNSPEIFDINNPIVFCSDCYLPVETKGYVEKYNYWISPKELYKCGYGLYLFFVFQWYLIINLLALIIICSIPYMIFSKKYADKLYDYCTEFYNEDKNNLNGFETNNENCTYFIKNNKNSQYNSFDWMNKYSGEVMLFYINILEEFATKKQIDDIVLNFNLISFITLFILFIVNLLFVSITSILVTEIDFTNISVSDYACMVSEIPKNLNAKAIESYLKYKDSRPIHEINLTYKLSEIEKLKKRYLYLNSIENKRESQIEQYYNEGILCFKKKKEYSALYKEKNEIIKTIEKLENDYSIDNFNGVAFLTFNYIKDAKKYAKVYPNSFIIRCLKNSKRRFLYCCCSCCLSEKYKNNLKKKFKLVVHLSPEPEDIIFEHLEYTFPKRVLRTIILFFFSLLLTGISFGIVVLLNYYQYKQEKKMKNKYIIKYVLSFLIAIVVSSINKLIRLLFTKFSDYEKPWTYTNKYLFTSIKLTLLSFTNSAIVPLVSNGIQFGWEKHHMLVNNMFVMFLCDSILSPLISITCFDLLINKLNLWFFITRKYKNEVVELPISQRELNRYFESPDMQISNQYSNLAKIILMTFFYVPIFPIGPIIAFIGVVLNYFVEKYKCLFIYKRPEKLNEEITFFYVDFFVMAFFAWAVGNYIFFAGTHSSNFYELFIIIFYGVLIIIPYNGFIRNLDILKVSKSQNKLSYEDAYFNFNVDYQRLNPKTQIEGAKNFIDRIVKNDLITKEIGEEIKNKLTPKTLKSLYFLTRQTSDFKSDFIRSNCLVGLEHLIGDHSDRSMINENKEVMKNIMTVGTFFNNLGVVMNDKGNKLSIDSNFLFNNNNLNNIHPSFSKVYTQMARTKIERTYSNKISQPKKKNKENQNHNIINSEIDENLSEENI